MLNSVRQVWHAITFSRPRQVFCLNCFGVVAAAVLLFSRCPSRLLQPELWAEDGLGWLHAAYESGVYCLAKPLAGYLQTLPRLAALLAVHRPLTEAPLIFAVIAFVIQLAPAILLLSARGKALIPNLPVRLLLVLYYISEPNSSEVYVNLTNAMWHLALLAFLLVVLPKPQTRAGVALECLVLVLAGLSGPFVLFIAPIAWWQVAAQRTRTGSGKRLLYAALLTACAIVQGWIVLHQAAGAREKHLGATLGRLVHILSDQIFLGGTIGGRLVGMLMAQAWWMSFWPAAICCLAAIGLGLYAFVKGPAVFRQFAVLSALIMVSALKSPQIAPVIPQWQVMQYPSIGDRYYIFPMLAWFATLLTVAARSSPLGMRWLARVLLLCCAVGVIGDWIYMPYPRTSYQESAKLFDQASPGTMVIFQENPAPWHFWLVKK
jgi:hypothetical protein